MAAVDTAVDTPKVAALARFPKAVLIREIILLSNFGNLEDLIQIRENFRRQTLVI